MVGVGVGPGVGVGGEVGVGVAVAVAVAAAAAFVFTIMMMDGRMMMLIKLFWDMGPENCWTRPLSKLRILELLASASSQISRVAWLHAR